MKNLSLILSIVALFFSAATLIYAGYALQSPEEITYTKKGDENIIPQGGLAIELEPNHSIIKRPPAAGPCGDICDGLFE